MNNPDTCVTLVPYFRVHEGQLGAFKTICKEFVRLTETEPKCMYYGFSFNSHEAHCREGYEDAEGLLEHVAHVGPLIEKALKISDLERIEAHGPAAELEKLKAPLADLNPTWYELELGFRRAA